MCNYILIYLNIEPVATGVHGFLFSILFLVNLILIFFFTSPRHKRTRTVGIKINFKVTKI